eukprot:1188659-Prorocentrum_minimum.AAC.2
MQDVMFKECTFATDFCVGMYRNTTDKVREVNDRNLEKQVKEDKTWLLWGVECTLAVVGTGGPVNRSNSIMSCMPKGLWGVECTLAVIGTGGAVK